MTVNEIEREFYLKNSPLPSYLVEMAEIGENTVDIGSVRDIEAGFPDEDFLDDVVLDLDCIIEQMHGYNKALPALKLLAEKLRQVQDTVVKSAEYGADELRALAKKLGL